MSKLTEAILTDRTGKDIAEKLHTLAVLKGIEVGSNLEKVTTMQEIRRIVQSGKAADVFQIGDQVIVPWTDTKTGTTYSVPMDVIKIANVTLKDGSEVPGLYLQWHYATPFGVQFDQYEAFYKAESELPAGTYNIIVGANWGNNCKANETYQFTLTKPVPAGGLLAGFYGMPDQAPTAWKVYSFADGNSAAIETVSVTAGSGGTNLGTFLPAGDGKVNSLHRLAYGYNRWSQSALRQWLNSDAAAGAWWASQNDYDRAPDQLSQKDGFLKGFQADFLECIQPVKVVTALNTVTDKAGGETEVTYDRFFPLSLEEMYIEPQLAGEGEVCPYWKHASGLAAKMKQYQTYPQIRTFAIENHVSPQHVRLRSASRGGASLTWLVLASGYVSNHYAIGANRCAPACAIC